VAEAPGPPHRAPPAVWALLGVGLLCYGLSSILVRAAGPVEPMAIAAWRTVFVTLLLAPAAALKTRGELARMSGREWAVVVGVGVVLGLHFLTWIVSVQLTTVAAASVLVTTSPLWIALFGLAGFGERPDRRTVLSIGVGVVGAALIGLGGAGGGAAPPNPLVGNALALGAAALVSVYYLVGRSVRQRASFLAYFAPVNAVAALTALAACGIADVPLGLPLPTLALCLAMAVGPGLIGHGSFAVALGYLPAATLGLLGLAEPVLASGMAAVFFDETPSVLALVGMAVVLASIGVVVTARRAPAEIPEA
jgi:drug/metabolite transporter (DMT)-like permease